MNKNCSIESSQIVVAARIKRIRKLGRVVIVERRNIDFPFDKIHDE